MTSAVGVSLDPSNELTASSNAHKEKKGIKNRYHSQSYFYMCTEDYILSRSLFSYLN